VKLAGTNFHIPNWVVRIGSTSYQVLAAYDSHEAERLNAMILWQECRPAGRVARVAEDNVRMNVGIEIFDPDIVVFDFGLKGSNGEQRWVIVATAIVGGASLLAIATDVHVCQVARRALQIDDVPGVSAVDSI
jgi:hypothetical protein